MNVCVSRAIVDFSSEVVSLKKYKHYKNIVSLYILRDNFYTNYIELFSRKVTCKSNKKLVSKVYISIVVCEIIFVLLAADKMLYLI